MLKMHLSFVVHIFVMRNTDVTHSKKEYSVLCGTAFKDGLTLNLPVLFNLLFSSWFLCLEGILLFCFPAFLYLQK